MKLRNLAVYFLTIVLLSGIALAQDEGPNNDAKKAYNEANQFLKQGRTDDALAKYKEAVAAYADFAKAYYWMGYCHRKKKDYVNAEKAYKTAIEKDPNLIQAYDGLGDSQQAQRKMNEAINSYQAGVNKDPEGKNKYTKKCHFGLGEIARKQENYKKGIEHFQRAIELDPGYGNALKEIGVCYFETGDNESAISAFEAAASVVSRREKADVHFRLGNAYRSAKRLDEAQTAYSNCLKTARRSTIKGGANFGLGEIYKVKGNTAAALKHYKLAANDRSWKQSAEYEIDLLQNPDKYTN